MKRFKLILTFSVCFILFAAISICCLYANYTRVEKEEKVAVIATIKETNYKEAYTTYVPMHVGNVNVMMPQIHEAKYLVTVSYEGISETFNNKMLYEGFKVGDNINVVLHLYYCVDNTVEKKIEIPE